MSFRRYQPGDIPNLARLAREAWPARPALGSRQLEQAGMEGYVEYSLRASNWTDIACSSEGVLGFLFGRIDDYPGTDLSKRLVVGEFPSAVRSFFKKGRTTPWHLSMAWAIMLTDLKLRLNMPASDASIEMFIVGSEHRGMGVGSRLIDRFLAAARESGASLVTVYTDDKMSDWTFYERRGFRRVGMFHDNITSHYSGADANGIIFALDLK